MKPTTLVVRSRRVILRGDREPQPASLQIVNGKIKAVGSYSARFEEPSLNSNLTELDLDNSLILPGIVDTHAHINEPGRTEWEGFQTATRAAAAGGITTLIDMPLNSIPATTSGEALKIKSRTAQAQCAVDYGFWGGVIPGNHDELKAMIVAGVMGFKCFLIESGVPEFPSSNEAILRKSMPILAAAGLPLLVHAELYSPHPPTPSAPPSSYSTFLASRPAQWEVAAIRMMIRLAKETRCRIHIVHLSAADALEDIRHAKEQGIPLTVETCPHYLSFAAEDIPDGATLFKCTPPIREKENQERLWKGLESGVIDCIVSDHSPCTPKLKELEKGDFEKAWGGISGLQLSVPAVWTEMKKRNIPLSRLTTWMSQNPALLAGLAERKGSLLPGFDADFLVLDPEAQQIVHSSQLYQRHSSTPYEGRQLYGTILKTFVRGNLVYDAALSFDKFSNLPLGTQLLRAANGEA